MRPARLSTAGELWRDDVGYGVVAACVYSVHQADATLDLPSGSQRRVKTRAPPEALLCSSSRFTVASR